MLIALKLKHVEHLALYVMSLEEEYLKIWKKHIAAATTSRKKLQEQLLTVKNYSEFEELKKKLLGEDHDQGWGWTINYSWFWNLLSIFFPIDNTLLLILKNGLPTQEVDSIQQEYQLKQNLIDIYQSLNPQSDLTAFFNILVDYREHSKNHLEHLDHYINLLEKAFKLFPAKLLNYFYQNSSFSTPLTEIEFVELHIFSKTLLHEWVKPMLTIEQKIYSIEEILILICLGKKTSLNLPNLNATPSHLFSDPLAAVLAHGEKHSLQHCFSSHSPWFPLYQKLEETYLHPETSPGLILAKIKASNPLYVLKNVYTQNPTAKKNPLFLHFLSLAYEFLITQSFKSDELTNWQKFQEGGEFLHWVSKLVLAEDKPLEIPGLHFPEKLEPFFEKCLETLNNICTPPPAYHNAEKAARMIILRASYTPLAAIECAKEIRQTFFNSRSFEYEFSSDELQWIYQRISSLFNDEETHLEQLKYILGKQVILNHKNTLLPVITTPLIINPSQAISHLLENLREKLQNLKFVAKLRTDSEQEKNLVTSCFNILQELLQNPSLSFNDLEIVEQDCLPILKPYFSHPLSIEIRKKIAQHKIPKETWVKQEPIPRKRNCCSFFNYTQELPSSPTLNHKMKIV